MKSAVYSAVAFAIVAATAAPAFAQQDGLTREQVRAELAEAIRTGDIQGDGETGQKLKDLFPGSYPAQARVMQVARQTSPEAAAHGKTRAEVKAELAEAIRTGDLIADTESGLKQNQLFPNRYPATSVH